MTSRQHLATELPGPATPSCFTVAASTSPRRCSTRRLTLVAAAGRALANDVPAMGCYRWAGGRRGLAVRHVAHLACRRPAARPPGHAGRFKSWQEKGNNSFSAASYLSHDPRVPITLGQGVSAVHGLLASGNPFEIVVLPILLFLGIVTTAACLLMGLVAFIITIVIVTRRRTKQSND